MLLAGVKVKKNGPLCVPDIIQIIKKSMTRERLP